MALPLQDETWEGAQEAATCPPPTAEHTAAYGQPELACDTPRLPPERRRATGSPSGLDRPLDHPSGRDPTVPRTAGRTENGRSPDGSGGGRDSSASCRGCTSSFTCLAWRPRGAIGTAGLYHFRPPGDGSPWRDKAGHDRSVPRRRPSPREGGRRALRGSRRWFPFRTGLPGPPPRRDRDSSSAAKLRSPPRSPVVTCSCLTNDEFVGHDDRGSQMG
jgi:hypothetical protein